MLQASVGLLYLGHVLLGLAATGQNENLALKKNAIQSSTAYKAPASRAVDGVADADFFHNSCSHTNDELPAWWTVDLGQETTVGRVRITTRNTGAERLDKFSIGLTNLSTWTSAPGSSANSPTNSFCKYNLPYPPAGSTTDYICDPGTKPGRYLFVYLSIKNPLTICELEAYSS